MFKVFERAHYLAALLIAGIVGTMALWSYWPDGLIVTWQRYLEPGDDPVIVIVNGEPITEADLAGEAMVQDLIVDQSFLDLKDDDIRGLLDDLIDQKLLAMEARRQGVDQEHAAQRAIALAEDRALSEILLRRTVDGAVTDETLRALYDEQVGLSASSEEVRARHILLDNKEDAEIIALRLKSGENFEALAKKISSDPGTASSGGDLGYFTAGQMVPEFSQMAFSTPVGKISKPFKSKFGWHILKVEDRRKQTLPSFDEMRPQILRYQTFTLIKDLLSQLRSEAKVDYVQGSAESDE